MTELPSIYSKVRTARYAVGDYGSSPVAVLQEQDVTSFHVANRFDASDSFTIRFHSETSEIEEINRVWLMPLFKLETKSAVHYSNVPELLMKIQVRISDLKPDLSAVDHFLQHGFVPLGQTFAEGLWKINTLHLGASGGDPKAEIDVNEVWTIFKDGLAEIFKKNSQVTFRLSGGIDTRLIVFALIEMGLRPSRVVSVQSPRLEDGKDADVEIPKMICQSMGWDLEVETPISEKYTLLRYPELGETVLSGLYGGEIYGGQAANFFPRDDKFSLLDATEISLNTFRSTFYESYVGSWSSPYDLHNYAVSPFLNRTLVGYLLSRNEHLLLDYALYRKHYDLLKVRFFDLPLCSGIAFSHPELALPQESSFVDPKQCARSPEKTVPPGDVPTFEVVSYAKEKMKNQTNQGVQVKNLQSYCVGLKRVFGIEF